MVSIKRGGRTLATVEDAGLAYRWLSDNEPCGVAWAIDHGYSVRDENGRDMLVRDLSTQAVVPVTGVIPPRRTCPAGFTGRGVRSLRRPPGISR